MTDSIAESFAEGEKLPDVMPGAQLLQPPMPVSQQESNWPLLTTSKGFFEGAMLARQQATGGATSSIAAAAAAAVDLDDGGEGWGDDDLGKLLSVIISSIHSVILHFWNPLDTAL